MLAEALKDYKHTRATQVRLCIVGGWSSTLSEEDQASFKEALEDYSISARSLLTILNNVGASFSLEALRKHRNQECPCQA